MDYKKTKKESAQADTFLNLARSLNESYSEKAIEQCEDNYVGYFDKNSSEEIEENLWFCKALRVMHGEEIKITPEKLKKIREKSEKIILVVLESPHVEEYNQTCPVAPAPALGMTGRMLQKHFTEHINDYVSSGHHHVILSNAIEYQCSLGVDTNIFRDRVWLNLWLCQNLEETFKKKVSYYDPDIVINMCTRGSHTKDDLAPTGTKTVINQKYIDSICNDIEVKNDRVISKKTTLKELTQVAINESIVKNRVFLQGAHPSSWYSEKNRNITRA